MDFRPENTLNLALLGQFDQFFFTILPSMYPQEVKTLVGINFGEKKPVRPKRKTQMTWKMTDKFKFIKMVGTDGANDRPTEQITDQQTDQLMDQPTASTPSLNRNGK